jgi:hypothetical protein
MNTEKGYMLFCDESERKGRYFSNFFGGVRIGFSEYEAVTRRLNLQKRNLGLTSEPKWEKTDATTVERYCQLISAFFDEIANGRIWMRVMFTQNLFVPTGLTQTHYEDAYYLLYYQFLKHGFGLRYMPPHAGPVRFRVFLDEIGDTQERVERFRGFIVALAHDPHMRRARAILDHSDVTEVHSHEHVLMQCLDIVLGSIPFRLNDKHKAIPEGKTRRGKRTIAKEKLYRHIYAEIKRVVGKTFNPGITTGVTPHPEGRWSFPYRHWIFVPKNHTIDSGKTKS